MTKLQLIQANRLRLPAAGVARAPNGTPTICSKRIAAAGIICLGLMVGTSVLILGDLPAKWLLGVVGSYCFAALVIITGRLRDFLLPLLIFSASLGIGVHLVYIPDHSGVASGISIDVNDICLCILYVQWMQEIFYHRRVKMFFFKSISVPFLGILTAATLSLWKSEHLSLSVFGLIDFFKTYAFFFFLANTIRRADDLLLIFRGLQLNLVFLGVVCIIEVVLQTNFNNAFELIHQTEWDEYQGLAFRAGGLTTPTYTGGYVASILPLMVVCFSMNRELPNRALSAAALLLGATALVLTLTRTAFVSLGFGFVIVAVYSLKHRLIRVRHLLFPLLAVAVLIFSYSNQIFSRLGEGGENLIARMGLNLVALNMIFDNPVLGVGINTYHEEMDAYTPNTMPHNFRYVVHNKFLLLWAEIGAIGFFSFLFIWKVAITQARKVMRSAERQSVILGIGLLGALAALSINMNLEAYAEGGLMYPFWMVVALVAALNGPIYASASGEVSNENRTFSPTAGASYSATSHHLKEN
jgi:O-antigen ligase